MKKIIKSLTAFILVFTMLASMVGCGKKEEISATETVNIILNTYLFKEDPNIEKVGLTLEDVKNLHETLRKTYKDMFKVMFESIGGGLSDEEITEVSDAFIEMLGKVTVTVEEGKAEGNKKQVKIIVNAIDFEPLVNKAVEETQNDPEFSKDTFLKIYKNKLVENMKTVEPSVEQSFDWTFELMKDSKATAWLPVDEFKFGNELGGKVLKQ